MASRRRRAPASLTARLLGTAGVVLAAFVLGTALILDNAFRDSARAAVQQRLQAQVYILLSAAEVDAGQHLRLPEALPEARFSIPGSGLYALVTDADGDVVWRSPSLLGQRLAQLPEPPTPGVADFGTVSNRAGDMLFALAFSVSWEIADEHYRRYTFRVIETRAGYDAQVGRFRRSLWGWLLAAAAGLLAVQVGVLRWALRPLRRLAHEINDIENGRRDSLGTVHPAELMPLTRNLNQLIAQSRASLQRYRNAVGDLAHTLKTPLAVLRGLVEHPGDAGETLAVIDAQVARMNDAVEYQLQRAAASGRVGLSAPVSPADTARKILGSLRKVYRDKNLDLAAAIGPRLRFYGDEGDLLEVLGNLCDNACKWASGRVRISAVADADGALTLHVDDDGPGVPVGVRERIRHRGERADPATPGHGIGLAVVCDIVENVYGGALSVGDGPLGGARVSARFPPSVNA